MTMFWKFWLLTLSEKVLSISEVKGLPPSLLSCKCLIVDAQISELTIPGIASLLQGSSNLDTLLIDLTDNAHKHGPNFRNCSYNFDGEKFWTSQTRIFKCLLVHLKTVKIVGLMERCGEFKLALIQFLLKNARVLEKMVITMGRSSQKECSECSVSHEYRHVTQKLLSFARSSPNAVILFTE